MKIRLAVPALAAFLMVPAVWAQTGGAAAAGAEKVGVIDVQVAITSTSEGKQAAAELQSQFAPRQTELTNMQKQMEDIQTRMRTGQTTLSDDEKARLAREGDQLQRSYQRKSQDAQDDFNEAQREIVDRIGRKMNMMEQVINIPEQEVITKDNATVTADGVAFFQVFDAAKASYEVANLENAITVLTMTNIRSVMGSMDLDQVLSHRDEINERLLRVVDAAVSPWGVKVNRIEIKDIVPPADLVEAMGRQMKAERVKRADILQAEGQRQSAILRAEGQKQSQILEAEGRREAAFRDAEARERSAEAEAKATQMVSQAIAQGDVAALNYFIADKYIKAFGQLADSPNQKIIMLPIEAVSVLGSLAGIGEIAKATFGESAASAQAAARRASPCSRDLPDWRRSGCCQRSPGGTACGSRRPAPRQSPAPA